MVQPKKKPSQLGEREKPKNKTKEGGGTGGSSCIHSYIQCEMSLCTKHGRACQTENKIQLCAVSEGHLRVGDKSRLKVKEEDFVGGPVGRIPCFNARGTGSIPGHGTRIPHPTWQPENEMMGKDGPCTRQQ